MNKIIIDKVIEQFGDSEYFKECAPDIANYGAAGGFNGFIYYSDTVPFGESIRDLIKPELHELARDCGYDGIFSLLNTFTVLIDLTQDQIAEGWYESESEYHIDVMNTLAWFALEEVARIVAENEEV